MGNGFHVGIKDILVSGGPTLLGLIVLSVYSLGVIWERWRYIQKTTNGQKNFLDKIRTILTGGNLTEAVTAARAYKGAAAAVVMASLVGPASRDERKRCAQRAADRAVALMQTRLTALGTIASVAPFIGLFGTVVGVMRAFKDLAGAAGAGPGVVAIGISEALVCTATGLFVAIPAVCAYNYFNQRAMRFSEEMLWISDEILESLAEKAHK